MAGPTTNRTVNIYINDSAAQTKLTALKANQDRLTDAIRKGEAAGKDMTDSIARLGNTQSKIKQLEDILSGKLAPTLQMVKARAMELRGELNRMSASESGFAEKLREYQAVNAQWQQMQTSIGNVGGAMGRAQAASNSFWKDAGKIALGTVVGNTVQAGLQAITGYIAGLVSGNAKLSDSLADVRKATGLTEGGVAKLNTELGKIDTRTASSQLRDIAIGLGQIGEAATKETVAAVDKIVVALGDEFGGGAKEVTTTLGVLRNNLQDVKSNNYGADILAIGNALNTLGAEGLATAPVVVDFANRMAGVAGTFKLTSGQILGLSATMQELGINVERGSTAAIKIFQKIASAPEAFAKVAGMEVKKFTDLINRDMLGAFNAVAVGAGKASGKNTEFARILKELDADGSGAGEVLSKLSSNQELLANKTALASRALKESSSITDEFNTKNNNLAANLEKLSKNISKWFANSTLTNLLNGIVSSIVNLRKETQSATEQFDKQVGSVVNLQTNIAPLLQRYDDLAKKSNKSAEENAEMKSIIEQVTAVMPSAVTQFDKYGNAIAISTKRVREFISAEKDRLKVVNSEAIKENEKALRKEQSELQIRQKIAEEISKTGTYQVPKKMGSGKEAQQEFRQATPQEVAKALEAYKQSLSTVNGRKLEIERLNGDALQKELDKQELDRKIKFGLSDNPYLKGLNEKTIDFDKDKPLKDNLKKEFEITKQHYTDLDAWLKQAKNDWANALNGPYEAALEKYKKNLELRRRIVDQEFADGIIDEKRYAEKIVELQKDDVNGRIVLAKSFAKQSTKAEDDLQAALTESAALGVQNRKNRLKAELQEIPQWINDVLDALQVAGEVSNLMSGVNSLISENENRRLAQQQKVADKEKQILDKKLANKKITEKKYNAEVDALNAKMEEKRKEAAIAQFKRDQALAVINIAIQTAQAVVKAVAASPLTGGLPWSAIVGGIGIAQAGLVMAKKPPEFGDGGILPGKGGVTKGASHQSGGIALIDQNGKKVGEVEGDEPILSKETYVNNREIVNALLESSMRLGGKRINMPWLYTQSKPINIQKAVTAMQYNSSRSSNPSPEYRQNNTGGQQPNGLLDDRSLEVMERWIAQMEKGVKASVYYNEWDKTNNEINDLKKMGSSKPNAF